MPRAMTLTIAAFVILATGLAHSAAFAERQSTFTPGTSQRFDPYKNFRFRLVFDGRTVAGFEEVSGLAADGDVVNYREGESGTGPVQKITGINKATDVTLKRGVVKDDADLQAWLNGIKSPQARKEIKLELVDEGGRVTRVYLLHRAWISKFQGPHLNGKGNDVAIEELVLGHEGIDLLSP